MRVSGKVSVVTGGSSGMGRSLVCQIAEAGGHVACCDVNMAALNETVELARKRNPKVKVSSHFCDVSERDAVNEFAAQVINEHGAVHLVFANAGIATPGPFIHGEDESAEAIAEKERLWDRCFDIDYFGVLHCVRAFLPHVVKQEEGYMVLTASVNSFWTWPEHGSYTAAKYAVRGLTEALLCETQVKAPHVHVATVMPGGVQTGIASNIMLKEKEDAESKSIKDKLDKAFQEGADLSADEAAEWILDGVANNRTRILVGWDAVLLDYFSRFLGPHQALNVWKGLHAAGIDTWGTTEPDKNLKQMQALATSPLKWFQFLTQGGGPFMLFVAFPMAFFRARRNALFKAALLTLVAYQCKKRILPKL